MADGGSGEKTEQATPKRKKDERKKGHVFQSKDIVAAFFILAIFFLFRVLAKFMYKVLSDCMIQYLQICGEGTVEINVTYIRSVGLEVLTDVVLVAGPLLLVGGLINIIASGAQTKWLFSGEALKPKFNRLNPIEGIKKLFSLRSLVELGKSLLKIAVIAAVITNEVKNSIGEFARLYDMDVLSGLLYAASRIFTMIMMVGLVFLVIGVADYGYQWWQYNKDLKMTKQEIKEEYKQMEGDPQIKGKIKQKQREMSQRRMMQAVPESDVVVRNPTHFAVAIRYDPERNSAPVIVAKGQDRVALKIVEIAEENNVVTLENKPLARALYHEVPIDQEIPPQFYQEVAEVLAWVYDLQKRSKSYGRDGKANAPSKSGQAPKSSVSAAKGKQEGLRRSNLPPAASEKDSSAKNRDQLL